MRHRFTLLEEHAMPNATNSKVAIFWDPEGFELDPLGSNEMLDIADGDTPRISTSVRMLSIDTPEVHYPGTTNPIKHDAALQELADWLKQGKAPADADLAAQLYPRLVTGKAGSLQKSQGDAAAATFRDLLAQRLNLPNGRKRKLYVRAAATPFDQYGRLLAYIAPNYSVDELATLSLMDRATFNLLLIDSGWAAFFPIYPSLPKYADLVVTQAVAQSAVEQRRGAWADPLSLVGYEFRMCYRLWETTSMLVKGRKLGASERMAWIERYCADMTTREIFLPQSYWKVPPANRLFIWPGDVNEAVGRLNLTPGAQ
jgi:endonuclease YncB( thermonuclease family)